MASCTVELHGVLMMSQESALTRVRTQSHLCRDVSRVPASPASDGRSRLRGDGCSLWPRLAANDAITDVAITNSPV